ncbi:MAG: NAD(P)H-quinone oxidoreductase [Deltaproteobacteria bacterium]|nr:NAD(P)H-quinone oxidoreductase [Deltaproteobacteria bacterium]
MKAVTFKGYGDPSVLTLSDIPQPRPGPEQVLVRVRATALNRADTLQRKGLYPPPPGDSDIPGLELAGEVVEWGEKAGSFSVGQKVFALVGGGGYAEYALVDKDMAMTIPHGWSFEKAAAIPEVFFTANETIFELGGLQPGQTLLLHAGGSGVGTAAIQMAHHIGAKVYFTAGSQDKIDRGLALGADGGINYKTQDFVAEIKKYTNGAGADVVEDFLGASYLQRNMESLKNGGRLIIVALMGGSKVELDMATLQRKRLQIKGSVMRSRPLQDKRDITHRFKERWLPVLKEGKINEIIDCVFPLEQVREAHEYMELNKNFGKIILKVD